VGTVVSAHAWRAGIMATEAGRTKVAILGGGVGAMVTAFWLTNSPELQANYDVTVHQMGWRLGGKGASGRNLDTGSRIEEHGLHVWFGFYDNAFFTMKQCYDQLAVLDPRPAVCPITTLDQAFMPSPTIGLYECYKGQWLPHRFDTPEMPDVVRRDLGTIGPLPTIWHVMTNMVAWAVETWDDLCSRLGIHDRPFPHEAVKRLLRLSDVVEFRLDEFDAKLKEHLLSRVQRMADEFREFTGRHRDAGDVCDFLKLAVVEPLLAFKEELWRHVIDQHQGDDGLRVFFTTFDTFVSVIAGVLDKDVLSKGFMSVDHMELTDFLREHGATPFTLDLDQSPFLRGWYDAAFAYDCVDGIHPDLAAGTGIHGILRLIGTYGQYVAYKMRAGMGDTIFGPLYQVLVKRGVRFEFFHEITDLLVDDDGHGDGAVTGIRITRQAHVLGGAGYDPLVDVAGLPCWPSQPRWEQLVDGDVLRDKDVNFEHGQSAPDAEVLELRRGHDFDQVVLALPPEVQKRVCVPLRSRSPRYAEMLDNSRSAMTQAGQVWTTTTLDQLGSCFGGSAIATSFVEPIDTYCDMSHLLPREVWGVDPPQGVAYFCGVMTDQPDQETADKTAAETMLDLLTKYGTILWPKAADGQGAFDWSYLFAPGVGNVPGQRLAAQYLRANFVPTERYVLSPAGLTVHRLESSALADDDTTALDRFPNLYLAGDWTLNGVNGGCVEAATMSGMQASRAICGEPKVIVGENVDWMSRIEQ
jgi:uncharacterized protein with NAD-binding domain and iron-sulfur cluster